MTTLFCNTSTWLFCLYIYATWLLCATYILYEYFVHLYSTWLLCLFYAATLWHIYSKWLLCSASVLHGYSANIYILYGYSVLHSTWQLCLHIFYACPALHIFIFSASLTALICLFCIHSSSSTLNSPPSNSRGFEIHIIHSPQDHSNV